MHKIPKVKPSNGPAPVEVMTMVNNLTPEQRTALQRLLADPASLASALPDKLDAEVTIKITNNNAELPVIKHANRPVHYGLVLEVLQKLVQALQIELSQMPYPADRTLMEVDRGGQPS